MRRFCIIPAPFMEELRIFKKGIVFAGTTRPEGWVYVASIRSSSPKSIGSKVDLDALSMKKRGFFTRYTVYMMDHSIPIRNTE